MNLVLVHGLTTRHKKLPSNFRISNQNGFSLIEILIAIILFAVIGITVISLVQSSIKTRDEILTRNKEDSQIEIVFSQIERDFVHIYSPITFDYIPEKRIFIQNNSQFSQRTHGYLPIPTYKGDNHHFIFFSSSNRRKMANIQQSHFTWIQYQLFDDKLKRFVFPEDPYGPYRFKIDEIRGDIMMEKVKSIQFEYWEPMQKKFIENLWEHVKYPLRAIRVTIVWFNTKNIEQKSIRIFQSLWPNFTPTPPKNAKKQNNNQGNENIKSPMDESNDNPFSKPMFQDNGQGDNQGDQDDDGMFD